MMTAADLDLTPIIVIPVELMALKAYSYKVKEISYVEGILLLPTW
jgi:hypothetical protein